MTIAVIDRSEHKLLGLLREFDASDGWAVDGATSLVAWLSWRCGVSPVAARERVRVAKALAELPVLDEAFRSGAITYSKARAVTRVATAENEETLATMARGMTAAELEKLCQMMRSSGGEAAEAEPQRMFSQRTEASGMVKMTLTVTAEEAATITSALDACAPTPNRRAEGLVAMADECLRGSAADRSPTEVIVHVDADELSGTTDEGRSVPAGTSRRLLCDAGVVAMLHDADGKTLDVGRKSRTIPAAIRRALKNRDRGCRFPGCANVIVDGHHIDHWCDGGETKLGNLVSLCRHHHRFLHEGGGSIETAGEAFVFRNAAGAMLANAPQRSTSYPRRAPPMRTVPSPMTTFARSTGTASATPSTVSGSCFGGLRPPGSRQRRGWLLRSAPSPAPLDHYVAQLRRGPACSGASSGCGVDGLFVSGAATAAPVRCCRARRQRF